MKIIAGCALLLIGAAFEPFLTGKHETILDSLPYWGCAMCVFPGLCLLASGLVKR